MHLETKRIETKRLILRQFQMEDAAALYQNYGSDPNVIRCVQWPIYPDVGAAEHRMRRMQEGYEKGAPPDWAIELRELGQVIGSIGVVGVNEKVNGVEVGYCIGSRWWNQGITSEALAAVIQYFFQETEVLRIEAYHDPNNPGSGAVMRKCGLIYEGTQRQASRNNSGVCDLAGYAILKSDYQKEHSI